MIEKQNNLFENLLVNKLEVIDLVLTLIESRKELLLTYFNQHSFNIWYENNNFRNILEHKFIYYLDGFGIWFAVKLFRKRKIKRFNASEVNDELFNEFTQKQIPLIIIGGIFTQATFSNKQLNIELYINGYEDLTDFENILIKISKSKSKVIIIGVGVPLQEELAFNISQRISNLQIICVGNFLEFYFGTIKRAPKTLHNSGFEWLYRLMSEPKRLWKRYLYGIPLFVFRVFQLKGRMMFKTNNNKVFHFIL